MILVDDQLDVVPGDCVLHGRRRLRRVLVLGADTGSIAPARPGGVDDLVRAGRAGVSCGDRVVAAGFEGADRVEHSGYVAASGDGATGGSVSEEWHGEKPADS